MLTSSASSVASGNDDDAQALRELEARPLELPAGLEVEWLGVSGYRLAYEGKSLYIDPYLSRVPLRNLLLRRPTLPKATALDRYLPAADDAAGVLVGHTHFDHAVDAPAVARRYGCLAYGSSSLVTLMGLHGLGDRAVEVEPHRAYELGYRPIGRAEDFREHAFAEQSRLKPDPVGDFYQGGAFCSMEFDGDKSGIVDWNKR